MVQTSKECPSTKLSSMDADRSQDKECKEDAGQWKNRLRNGLWEKALWEVKGIDR